MRFLIDLGMVWVCLGPRFRRILEVERRSSAEKVDFLRLFLGCVFGMFEEGSRSLGQKGSAEGAGPVGDSFERFVIDFGGVRGFVFEGFWRLESCLEWKHPNCKCR